MSHTTLRIERHEPEHIATPAAEAILDAVVFGAQKFLNDSDWPNLLESWLRRLGEATGTGQVRIFQNDQNVDDDVVRSSLYAQWLAPGVIASPASALQHVSFEAVGCGRWIDILARGEVVAGNTDELPESERPILQQEGDIAVAIVPVFSGDRWWGFIGFADCARKRTWTASELHALSAAAGILGAAVARRSMQERITSAVAQEELAADIGEVLTATANNLDDVLDVCSARIAHHLHADLVRVWALDVSGLKLTAAPAASSIGPLPASQVQVCACAVGRIADTRTPEVWRGALPEVWTGSNELLGSSGLTGGAGHPLVFDGKLVGVVIMLTRESPAPKMLEALFSITDELALAIERSRAQSALQASEDRYRRLVDATIEGICIHDGKVVLDCNPALAGMVGIDVADVLGRNPFDFIHPDSRAEAALHIRENHTHAYEVIFLRMDGTTFPAEVKGRNFTLDGQLMRVTTVRDITERKRAENIAIRLVEEQAERELADHKRMLAEFMADASRILASSFDTTTTLTQLAHHAVHLLGECCVVTVFRGDQQEVVAAVHADANKQQALEAALAAWMRHHDCAHPLTIRQQNGEAFIIDHFAEGDAAIIELGWHAVMSVPITSGGELIGSIMFAVCDERRSFDDQQMSVAEELGRRAAVALESARSYRDAQAATVARDEMLAVVAHDLRNPLNTIFMASNNALDMIEDPAAPGRRTFQMIKRSTEHMNRLIQDLLDATRLQSGQLTLERVPTSASRIVDEAVELLEPLAVHAGISFSWQIADDVPPISADPARVLQVLSNLVGNALKFTKRGGSVTVIVTAEPNGARFCVRDTGAGIASDQLPHIFGRFWQAQRTDRRGIGLGLAIAKGIVEAHGGSIWVESTLGVGSDFLFTI